jgi:lysophospholipase L1-like esterase
MRKGLRSVIAPLALLGASVALALGAAEASLRVFPQLMPEEVRLRLHWQELGADPVSSADPYLGFVYPPNHEGRLEREDVDFAFTYTTDEHGFRNPSPWPERADIVVLGDSMAFGYGVDDEEAWTALLADELPGTQIINLGLIGAAPQQYFRIYETFGQALRPDLVLFCLFPGNDLADAEQFEEWLQAGSPGNYAVWRRSPGQDLLVPKGLRDLLEESYLLTLLQHARKRLGSQFSGRTIDFADGGRLQLAPAVYAGNQDLARPDHPSFRLVVDAVERTRALAARGGSKFLALLVPTKEEVYLPLLDEPVPPATAPFAAHLSETGLPHLDLTPYFQAGARQGERLFFEVDGHPNAAGYRLIAEVVLDHLRSPAQASNVAGLRHDRLLPRADLSHLPGNGD